jgi:putative redox protein
METIRTSYLGGYRTQATHVLSSNQLITDAPLDNNGKGEAFSPTDLVATALGSCMLTLMDMTANKFDFSMGNADLKITKVMASNPRRISEILLEFDLRGKQYTQKQKEILERAAHTCPVAMSIHPDIKVDTRFHY